MEGDMKENFAAFFDELIKHEGTVRINHLARQRAEY
jgi:hypothetical protein